MLAALQSINTFFLQVKVLLKFQGMCLNIHILYQDKNLMIFHKTKLILFAQNHFQDCPQFLMSCEKCGKENIPSNEVSSFLLKRWHTLSELHLSGQHKWTVHFTCTDCQASRRKVKSFIIIWCSKKNWELGGLGYVIDCYYHYYYLY